MASKVKKISENKDRKEYLKLWHQRNKERRLNKIKEDRKLNPIKYKERNKKSYAKNKKGIINKTTEYRKSEKGKEYKRKYNKRPENRKKESLRSNSRYHFEKKNICSQCGLVKKTELHHISYYPNIAIEVCSECHLKEHGKENIK